MHATQSLADAAALTAGTVYPFRAVLTDPLDFLKVMTALLALVFVHWHGNTSSHRGFSDSLSGWFGGYIDLDQIRVGLWDSQSKGPANDRHLIPSCYWESAADGLLPF